MIYLIWFIVSPAVRHLLIIPKCNVCVCVCVCAFKFKFFKSPKQEKLKLDSDKTWLVVGRSKAPYTEKF